ncbi:MAG: glycosyltransferase family 4 protein [Candidatus Pacebacteria bacterium]|nr:glycosyltransferase family 4 protein [Candidatus Paceibacterota bacterium]
MKKMIKEKQKSLLYIANARIPTEKAHGIQIMKMCEAFSEAGLDVELVFPYRKNFLKEDPFKYYNVGQKFKLKQVFSIDSALLGETVRFYLQYISFTLSSFFYALFHKTDYIYSRSELPLFLLSFIKKNLCWEIHTKNKTWIARATAKRVKKIVVISGGLREFLINQGVSSEKIIVAHDGVDLKEFDIKKSKEELREELGLPQDKKIVGYVGKMSGVGESKGVEGIIEAFSLLNKKNENTVLMLVGVNENEKREIDSLLHKFNVNKKSCILIGHILHIDVPKYLKVANVLVMNYSSSEHFFSPLKLFEYMASGVPIVTSDVENIREVLDEYDACFVKISDPKSLANNLNKVLLDSQYAQSLSKSARKKVEKYTWNERVLKISSVF